MGASFSDYLCKELGWESFCEEKKASVKKHNTNSTQHDSPWSIKFGLANAVNAVPIELKNEKEAVKKAEREADNAARNANKAKEEAKQAKNEEILAKKKAKKEADNAARNANKAKEEAKQAKNEEILAQKKAQNAENDVANAVNALETAKKQALQNHYATTYPTVGESVMALKKIHNKFKPTWKGGYTRRKQRTQ